MSAGDDKRTTVGAKLRANAARDRWAPGTDGLVERTGAGGRLRGCSDAVRRHGLEPWLGAAFAVARKPEPAEGMRRFLKAAATVASLAATVLCLAQPLAGPKWTVTTTPPAEPLIPVPARVVIVATFEAGRDTGDRPGELQEWLEGEHLTQAVDVPGVRRLLYTDGHGLFAMVCGSREEAALGLMTFGLNPGFDLTHAYWLVAGIADVNPMAASLGSAVWVHYVVNGDVAYELDSRDAPPDWPYGIVPLIPSDRADRPAPTLRDPTGMVYELNPRLVAWACGVSRRDAVLRDNAHYRHYRSAYVGYPKAMGPPAVLEGASLGSVRYWHGPTLNRWATDWTNYWTNGRASFVVSDPEDHLICGALAKLATLGRADFRRVMILRTGAEYTLAPHGRRRTKKFEERFPGDLLAYDNAFRAGAPVVREIVDHWDRYDAEPP
ncbi:MAG: purine nucleoside permease [Opitutaceae bacterium]